MLNISHNQLNKKVNLSKYSAFTKAHHIRHFKYFNQFLFTFAIIGIIILFLPWTQTVTGTGAVTTLTPEQRPQTIQSPIPGRIEEWFVREGDYVNKGDTILFISEIKNEYQDPNLVLRTKEQRDAKTNALSSYKEKVKALDNQVSALRSERQLKIEQAENKLKQAQYKVKSDSIDLIAAKTNKDIAEKQYNRTVTLQEEGLKSTADVEDKRLKLQETEAKLISQENKLLASKNDLINARIDITRTSAEYADKISKAQSDKYTASSAQYDTEAQISKLENASTNYELRDKMRFILAPQNGYINKAIRAGIGETFKEGEQLVGIMPSDYDLAVETYVAPIDLPLIHVGEQIRVQFDGWPAIVFSGWPDASFGTYGGKVVAVETFISPNGKFRVLIAPDETKETWPKNVRVGSGARTIALLNDVPIWYELWRKINGFPPDYYTPKTATTSK
ncbi:MULTISPECIES: HlyD family secretion protein [Croceibacter]|jgi:adhesin transport system membrane fusion protein|nr:MULTISPECIES: biotin/lipoyl-binding protein [Croceibacter]MBG26760.1 biotin attachment protein [Croceibacter sp.]MBW4969481.1 HlyD family secretion protein [Croceibacter atlanticus]|tara:strand:- start:580 stop:1923 length:1344 start_codon:yes stop_codon:yes gene_type:complete